MRVSIADLAIEKPRFLKQVPGFSGPFVSSICPINQNASNKSAVCNRQLKFRVTCPFPTLTCPSKHVRIRALAGFLTCVADFTFADRTRSELMSVPLQGRRYAGLRA